MTRLLPKKLRRLAPEGRASSGKRPGLSRDVDGGVSAEYVILVGTVGIAFMFAMLALGPKMVESYQNTRNVIASQYP